MNKNEHIQNEEFQDTTSNSSLSSKTNNDNIDTISNSENHIEATDINNNSTAQACNFELVNEDTNDEKHIDDDQEPIVNDYYQSNTQQTIELQQMHQEQHDNPQPESTKTSKKIKACPFIKKHKTAVLVLSCMVLSFASALAGTYTVLEHYKNNSKQPVMYQSVNSNKNNSSSNNNSIKEIADATMDCVVEIKTESISTHNIFQQAVVSGAGSGVILSKDGYIVTNHHVIEDANKITVTLRNGKSYPATLIGSDALTDLAVLKIEASNLKPAIMGKSANLAVGDTAVAIGNPLGSLGGTVTSGIISALDREVTIENQQMHLLQTNAAINPGNSGGGLFNANGELIGIVNAKSSGESIEGLGFAIPIDRAKVIIENIIDNGYVKGRASLGVTLVNGTSTSFFSDQPQVFIYSVEKDKAADRAGLQRGDQILRIDDKEITQISDVASIISSHNAGDSVKILVLRKTTTKEIKVVLGEAAAPQKEQEAQMQLENN